MYSFSLDSGLLGFLGRKRYMNLYTPRCQQRTVVVMCESHTTHLIHRLHVRLLTYLHRKLTSHITQFIALYQHREEANARLC